MTAAPGARAALGDELLKHRKLARISGQEMAAAIGTSQSRVSRIERGQARIRPEEVTSWLDAVSAHDSLYDHVLGIAKRADNEAAPWKHPFGRTAHQQRDDVLERRARTIKAYLVSCVPGLLQTAEYNAFLLRAVGGVSEEQLGAAIAAKLRRQQVLYKPETRFEAVLTESVLRQRMGGAALMAQQLLHIAELAQLPTVDFGYIPTKTNLAVPFFTSFTLYELPDPGASTVTIELEAGAVPATSPDDVHRYSERFEQYRDASIRGAEAIDDVRTMAREMTEEAFGKSTT